MAISWTVSSLARASPRASTRLLSKEDGFSSDGVTLWRLTKNPHACDEVAVASALSQSMIDGLPAQDMFLDKDMPHIMAAS